MMFLDAGTTGRNGVGREGRNASDRRLSAWKRAITRCGGRAVRRDIKILAGAMEIELARRRGERVLDEGEQRGGDVKSFDARIKVTQCVTLPPREKMQRSRDRAIATEPEAVTTYVRREARAPGWA